MPEQALAEPPLKHTAFQYFFVAGLCELALKRGHESYYAEAADSFLALEPSMATATVPKLFGRLYSACASPSRETIMEEIIARLLNLHARAAIEEAAR